MLPEKTVGGNLWFEKEKLLILINLQLYLLIFLEMVLTDFSLIITKISQLKILHLFFLKD